METVTCLREREDGKSKRAKEQEEVAVGEIVLLIKGELPGLAPRTCASEESM